MRKLLTLVCILFYLEGASQTLSLDFKVTRVFMDCIEEPLVTHEKVVLVFEGIGVDFRDGRLPRLTERIGIITEHECLPLIFESLLLEHPQYKHELNDQTYYVVLNVVEDGLSLFVIPLKPWLENPAYSINLEYEVTVR